MRAAEGVSGTDCRLARDEPLLRPVLVQQPGRVADLLHGRPDAQLLGTSGESDLLRVLSRQLHPDAGAGL